MKVFKEILLPLALCGLALPAFASDAKGEAERVESEARAQISARLRALQLPVTEVRPAELDGFFEVLLDGNQSIFITRDGSYFFTGDLYQMMPGGGLVNISEQERTNRRKQLIDNVDESRMVVFSPADDNVKATVNVFTDIDCGYCRKLHQEVPELNRLGIAVRYLAYPRAGIESRSYDKIVSAWCADDPQEALTLAKAGQEIKELTCDNPVAAQYRLGQEVGVTGTPALVYEDGTLVPGYMPADRLARQLGVIN